MRYKKSHLFLTAALIWGVPGIIITTKGVRAYTQLPSAEWWLFLITLAVLISFHMIFSRVVAKYSAHIENCTEPCSLWNTFPSHGWVLILFMMGLGISLRFIQGVPIGFFASFYSGLGPMLLLSAVRFLKKMQTHAD